MQVARLFRHVTALQWRTRARFPPATLDAIERAIGRAEATHGGEIRFVIESALAPLHIINDLAPRARALDVFARLLVWDTEHNNGVLVYVNMADRNVEIVADRGFLGRVGTAEWEAVCRLMEAHFRAGRFEAGSIAGVDALGTLLATHFPPAPARQVLSAGQPASSYNQLPDRPTLL